MSSPDPASLPTLVRATYLAMCGTAPEVPAEDVVGSLPPDLHALMYAVTHHPRSAMSWTSLFDRWDFQFSIEPIAPDAILELVRAFAGHSARTELPGEPLFRLGRDAGGTDYFVGVTEGASSVIGPERAEDYGTLEEFFARLWERADMEPEPALMPYVEPGFFGG